MRQCPHIVAICGSAARPTSREERLQPRYEALLAAGEQDDGSVALGEIRVSRCMTTHKRYKGKLKTAQQLSENLIIDHPDWTQRIKDAIKLQGPPCRDVLAGMYARFTNHLGITDDALAMAVFWCTITDPALSSKATEAAAVLSDYLLTTDADALMQTCNDGIVGIATGLMDHDVTGPSCGDLATQKGWTLLLGATLAAYSHSGTLVQQIQETINTWKRLKLTDFRHTSAPSSSDAAKYNAHASKDNYKT